MIGREKVWSGESGEFRRGEARTTCTYWDSAAQRNEHKRHSTMKKGASVAVLKCKSEIFVCIIVEQKIMTKSRMNLQSVDRI